MQVNFLAKTGRGRAVLKIRQTPLQQCVQQLEAISFHNANTIWTNLGWSDDNIIKGYHAHGECEQYHSEIKTDMDVERLPSGKFDTNEPILELTVLAYNILRLIGQETLKSKRAPKSKHPVKHRRIRTVISNLIQIVGHVTTHGRRVILALGRSDIWRQAFMDVYKRFTLA